MFEFDKTADGWTLIKDVGATPPLACLGQYDLIEFLDPNIMMRPLRSWSEVSPELELRSRRPKTFFDGPSEKLGRHAHERKANLGQLHAERLFSFQAVLILPEAQKHVLVFPGTIWQLPDGRRCIPVLKYRERGWYIGDRSEGWKFGFGIIGPNSWSGSFQLVQPVWTPRAHEKPFEFLPHK